MQLNEIKSIAFTWTNTVPSYVRTEWRMHKIYGKYFYIRAIIALFNGE